MSIKQREILPDRWQVIDKCYVQEVHVGAARRGDSSKRTACFALTEHSSGKSRGGRQPRLEALGTRVYHVANQLIQWP